MNDKDTIKALREKLRVKEEHIQELQKIIDQGDEVHENIEEDAKLMKVIDETMPKSFPVTLEEVLIALSEVGTVEIKNGQIEESELKRVENALDLMVDNDIIKKIGNKYVYQRQSSKEQ